jgi:hypothetical protein
MDNLKFGWWRQGVGAGVAVFYLATNVVFCHSAEARFWSARREAARKLNKNGGAVASASRSAAPTDALVLAQLPGGVRFDVHSPAPAYVTPVPAKEHLVGGKVPVFSSDLPRWLGEVVTPFGNIRDVHLSKRPGAPLVIHIQDLHDSTEAQRNIAGLVEALQDERGVSLVGLEGAQGAFATEAFRAFPDAEITKAVAAYFMEEGYLGGPEFAGITAKRVPLLWGVEDMVGYNANVTAVKESAQNRPVVELFLREARTLLNEIKTRRLSPALLEFDRNFSSYQSRKLSLGAYVRYLLKSSPSGAARAPNLVLLRDALTWEESLDFPRIERERASLLERMVQALPKQQLKNLVDKSALYRLGRISYGDYYRFFRTLCDENAIPISEYRQLHAYVRYVLLAERINRNDLLNELSAMELSVQDQLVSHPRERRVVNAARHLGQLERLVRHSYTPMDWGYHILHEDEIRNVGLTVRALAKEEGLPETLSPPSVEMLKPFENFCLQALGRNGAMVGNLLEKMAAEKRPSAVLVAGGFHTDGMTQLFRQKDVSYVVVTPKINGDLPEGHRSLDILARDPAPLEKLFAGETVNIPTLRIVNPVNSQNSPFVIWCVNLFAGLALALQVFSTQAPARLEVPLPSVATAYSVLDGETARVTLPHGTLTVTEGRTSLADTVATISGKEYSVQREPEGKVKVLLALALSTIMAGLGWAKQYRKELVAVGLTIISPAAGAATIATAALSPIFPSLVAFILFIVIPSLSWFKNRIVNVDDFKARYLNQGYPAEMVDAVFEFSNQKYAGVANEILDALKGFDDVGLVKKALGMLDQTGREDFQSNGRFLISAALWALRNGKDLEDVPGGLDNYIDRLRQGKPKDAHDQWAKDAATLLEKNKGNLSRVGVANGDMNLISSLNDAYKTMGGLDRPDQPSGDMLLQPNNSAIPPPFREFWNALALIVAQEGGYLYAGAGGDEFRVFIVGENISQRYERIVSRYNQMLAERYDFYTITASQKDEDSLKISLEQSGIPLWLVRNGKGYVVMVDRQFADENYDQTLKEKIKENNNWQIEQRSVSRTGLGPFSISLGGFEIDKLLSLLENRLEVNWLEKPLAMARVADWLANDSLAAAKNLSRNLFRMVQTTSELESNSQNNSLSDKNLRKIYEKPGVYESQSAPWLLPYQQFRDQVNGQKGTMVFGDVTRYYKEKVGKYWWSRLGLVLVDRMLTLLEKYPSVARFVPLHWFRQAEVRAVVRAFHKLKGSDDALGDAVRDAYRKVMLEWMFNNEVSDLSKFTPPAGVLITNFGPDNLLFFIPESASMPQFGEATFTDLTRKFKEALGRISGMGNTMKLLKGTLDPHLSILTVPTEAFESGSKAGDKTPDKRHQELGELIDLEGFFVSSSRMVGSSGANIENMKTVVDADLFEDANVLFLKYSKKTEKLSAFEIKKREMEEAKGMKALGVLRSRVQPFFPSALWNGFTRVVGRYFGEKAGQWAKRTMSGGALFYSVVVPIVELVIFPGFIFFNPLGLSLGVLIPFAALLAALTHGIPYLGRGPPKKWYQQSIDQFVVRLWASLALFTFAAFVGTWGFDLSTLDWKNTALSAYTFHAIYNFFAPEQYRLSVAKGRRATKGETASRPLDPQVIEESAAVEAKLNALLTELQSLGGDRLKTFQEISSLRYRPPARDADDQIQKYLDRILRQMALPEASSTSRHVADPVLFEAVFYDKLTALQKLKEKGQRGNSLDASNRAMVKTAALIFVPLASRLGWNSMADQIADLTFELLEPHRHDPIKKDLLEIPGDVNRNFTSLSKMDDHAHFLQRKITEGIKPLVGEHVEVRVRRKKLYSIAAKIINKPDHYRSAKDLKDVFNAVVVFNKKRNATWATTQGQLYTYIYGILEAKEIEGYIDGRDPKDSFEPKAREDTHVLYLTNRGFVEVQFKSWDVYREYKSKGQVTQRWKKPPHWIHKTKTILKALYEVKSLSLESDTFEITGDVGKNLDGIVRTLLPYEFPAITNSSGTEARVVRISRGSKVIDLVASREAGFELDDVPTVKAQKSGGQGQGPIDRRPMGTESLVSSSDVFFIVNYGNQTAQTLPSSDFSLRARLALLSNDKRQSGLQNANSELRELVPNGVRSPGFIELFFNLLTLSPSRADHRQEMFLSTAKSIATRKGLASTEELYMAWGTGLLSSEELGQAIYEEGKRVLADHRFGLDDPHVVSALQSMVVENQDIIGQVAALPPILGKCSEMLVRPDADQLKNKDLYKLVLGVSLGLISIETVRANFPSVTLAEKTMGQTHTFTISGSDRVGFILQIIRLLNENDAAVESIEAPPAESPGTETSIVVKTKVKEGSLDKLRMALGKIPTAESGPRLNSKARSYRLKILHELDIRPLESALEVLEKL